jgi:hypothetical protein
MIFNGFWLRNNWCQRFAVWFVADSEALSYQGTMSFDKRENLETSTAPAINYTAC